MDLESREKLFELRDRIAALEVVQCRMSHERVLTDKDSGQPLAVAPPLLGYKRVGLCPPQVRALRLACGHTMARYLLLNAIDALGAQGGELGRRCEALRAELSSATDELHRLDHRKGDAEALHARLAEERERRAEAQAAAAAQVQEAERRHNELVQQLGNVRDAVLTLLDATTSHLPPSASGVRISS